MIDELMNSAPLGAVMVGWRIRDDDDSYVVLEDDTVELRDVDPDEGEDNERPAEAGLGGSGRSVG